MASSPDPLDCITPTHDFETNDDVTSQRRRPAEDGESTRRITRKVQDWQAVQKPMEVDDPGYDSIQSASGFDNLDQKPPAPRAVSPGGKTQMPAVRKIIGQYEKNSVPDIDLRKTEKRLLSKKDQMRPRVKVGSFPSRFQLELTYADHTCFHARPSILRLGIVS